MTNGRKRLLMNYLAFCARKVWDLQFYRMDLAIMQQLRNGESITVIFIAVVSNPPVRRSQIDSYEIHRGKGLDVRLLLALRYPTRLKSVF
ncbi:hypothetical protein TNCV_4053571 [Trichonephila clavipes]|nr:hypothetical protein TNCV_4053571 [Trichonephila clavipes]